MDTSDFNIPRFLATQALFTDLSTEELERVAEGCQVRRLARGELALPLSPQRLFSGQPLLEGLFIEFKQHLALLHFRAFGERYLLDERLDARAHLDVLDVAQAHRPAALDKAALGNDALGRGAPRHRRRQAPWPPKPRDSPPGRA